MQTILGLALLKCTTRLRPIVVTNSGNIRENTAGEGEPFDALQFFEAQTANQVLGFSNLNSRSGKKTFVALRLHCGACSISGHVQSVPPRSKPAFVR
ncbi:MAG: hypothetical protein IT585_07720 [candidate division Zixibacteria bacterium]|nr:hypothetical protein [candidate division Zixibacteria bacterium]